MEMHDLIAEWSAKLWRQVYVEHVRKGSTTNYCLQEADRAVAEFTKRFTVRKS